MPGPRQTTTGHLAVGPSSRIGRRCPRVRNSKSSYRGVPDGYTAAGRASQLGLRTAAVEVRYRGSVCLNVACIPFRALCATPTAGGTRTEREGRWGHSQTTTLRLRLTGAVPAVEANSSGGWARMMRSTSLKTARRRVRTVLRARSRRPLGGHQGTTPGRGRWAAAAHGGTHDAVVHPAPLCHQPGSAGLLLLSPPGVCSLRRSTDDDRLRSGLWPLGCSTPPRG